jgi:hypothetical protein
VTRSRPFANSSINKTSSKAPTWTVGLDWQANRDLFLYVVTRRGYRSGGINGPTLAGRLTQFQSFSPEKVTDVEFGVRSDFQAGDVKFRFKASPFVGWYSGVQVPVSGMNTQASCSLTAPGGTDAPRSPDGDCSTANDPAGGTLLINAGKTRVACIDLSGRIAPTRTLSFDAGATVLDLKSRSLTVPDALLPYLRIAAVPFNLVAKTTLTAGARWTLPLPDSIGAGVLSVDYYHSSKVRSSGNLLPAYDVVNARFDLKGVAGTSIDVGVFVRNLFDKDYLASSNVGSEPLGSPLADLCRHYEAVRGEKVDHDVVTFHVLQFATLGTMQFAGTVAEPVPGDPHSIYLLFDLSLRQVILLALGALLGQEQPERPPLPKGEGANAALIAKLADTLATMKGATPIDDEQKRQPIDLIEWVSRADQMGAETIARDLAEVSAYLGQTFADWPAAEVALEAHVRRAGADQDAALFRLFSAIEGRRMQVFGPTGIGHAAENVTMPRTR